MKRTKTKNIEFQEGEWWYVGQADGRRRVASHEKKNVTRMWVDGKYVKKSHPLHKPGRYKTTDRDFRQCYYCCIIWYIQYRHKHS